MLTSEEVHKLASDELLGKPQRIHGPEADKFLDDFRKDVTLAKKNKWSIELPSEMEVD